MIGCCYIFVDAFAALEDIYEGLIKMDKLAERSRANRISFRFSSSYIRVIDLIIIF